MNLALGPLTPPTTPEKLAEKRSSIEGGFGALADLAQTASKSIPLRDEGHEFDKGQANRKPLEKLPEEPKIYSTRYQIDRELGHGAWSNVYRAFELKQTTITPTSLPPSPPTSPESKFQKPQAKILAVKIPSERMAHPILKKEACILTYLYSHNQAASYLVPFHGFDTSTHGIVMDAIPSSLEAFMKSSSNAKLTTKTMFDPIIGAKNWASLAKQLITGLAFLQDRQCIHGDIKPANILIRSDESTGAHTPLYCDFSSARVQSPNLLDAIEEVTAVTKDYLSPELLTSLLGRNGERAIATFASDIFALAVTLVAAAIGASPYAFAQVEIQKLSMAKEGRPIDFARQGENGSRIMKNRAVDRIVGPAVARNPGERINLGAWVKLTDEVLKGWGECDWTNGG